MKEIIQYHAKCNAIINNQMIEIIEANIDDPLNLDLDGYYYKTLGALLTHIYISDMNWMSCFMDTISHGVDLEAEVGPVPGYNDQVFSLFDGYKKTRIKLDNLMIIYAQRLDESDLTRTTAKTNRKGEKLERLLWQAMVHLFNHQTHHRGQISGILDNLQIENNYSNMILLESRLHR